MTVKDLIEELSELVISGDIKAEAKVCVAHKEWVVKSIDFREEDMLIIK